jgi:predicted phosphate transport protein (TIGR00153 family)
MSFTISRIFGRSPFGPLQEHIVSAHQCAELVLPLLDAVMAEDWASVTKLQAQITELENEADRVKTEIRSHLPRGIFLPVSRPDLLELLTRQDKIANRAKGIAGLILGRKLTFPGDLHPPIRHFAITCISACTQAREVVQNLDEMLESGFSEPETARVRALIHQIDATERDCDEQEAAIRALVFGMEDHLKPVDVIFMYRVIEWIGDLANHAEQVGHRLDQLLAR